MVLMEGRTLREDLRPGCDGVVVWTDVWTLGESQTSDKGNVHVYTINIVNYCKVYTPGLLLRLLGSINYPEY
jgi:hypothetical protein